MRFNIVLIFSIGFVFSTYAQKYTNSPFSSAGIGEFGNMDNALFNGVGNAATAFIDSTTLNFQNPSSYASLGFGQPLFSMGISSRFSQYSAGTLSHSDKVFGLNHFAFALPSFKFMGFAAGIKPFSRTGYEFYQKELLGTDSIKYVYSGNGGTHHAFFGTSIRVLNLAKHKFAVGANLGYVFGTTENRRKSYITTNSNLSGGVGINSYQLKSMLLEFGANYEVQFLKSNRLVLAATYTPQQNLTGFRSDILVYSKNVNDQLQYQITNEIRDEKGTITLPSSLGLGFSYSFRPKITENFNRSTVYQLTFFGDYVSTNWSAYKTSFPSEITQTTFANTSRISGGIQFAPHFDYLDRALTIGFLSRVRYRAGFQYATLPIVDNSVQQKDFGITFGFGIPIATQRSSSSINLSVTGGKRGNGLASSINENYLGVNVGVILAPGLYDRWFRKYKID
jgi:hypothetical protein